MEQMRELFRKYREMIAYVFFGGATTVINIAVYGGLAFMGCSTGVANAAAWVISVAFAYVTNRRWVFGSGSRGKEALREAVSFVACRLGTGVMDEILMILGVDFLGPRFIPAEQMGLWGLAVKVLVNVLVIILYYVFSKLIIFKNNQ